MGATRFVIVSHPRCGSHMLASALEGRRDCVANVEPFKCEVAPELVLAQCWSHEQLRSHAACGFILHRTQGHRGQPGAGIWRLLERMREVRIVLVHRRSQVARHVSHQRARKTGQWYCERPPAVAPASVRVDPLELATDVARYWRLYAVALQRFRRHPLLRFTYEQPAWRELQQFLGLEPKQLQPSTIRQQSKPLPELVSNWPEVADLVK